MTKSAEYLAEIQEAFEAEDTEELQRIQVICELDAQANSKHEKISKIYTLLSCAAELYSDSIGTKVRKVSKRQWAEVNTQRAKILIEDIESDAGK